MTWAMAVRYPRAMVEGVAGLSLARHIGTDLARAFAVLGLVFLSFVHAAPPAVAMHGPDVLTAALDLSYCGDAPADIGAHAPCHACRTAAIVLPPPAGGLVRLPSAIAAPLPAYVAPADVLVPPGHPEARGPPRLA